MNFMERKFLFAMLLNANLMMHTNLKTLQRLGGWKTRFLVDHVVIYRGSALEHPKDTA